MADAGIIKSRPCPNCGHCPTCGHTPQPTLRPGPYQPWPVVYPAYVNPWTYGPVRSTWGGNSTSAVVGQTYSIN